MKPRRASEERLALPDGLLGIIFDDKRGFVGVDCLTDEDDIDDEKKCTAIFDYDKWFIGDICRRCKRHVGSREAAMKRWIISKDGRRCGNFSCAGYEKANVEILHIDADGTVYTKCRECIQAHTYKSREYKDRRACKGCAHNRNVTVRVYHDGKEYARDTCDACDMERSAERHVATAQRLRRKAFQIRQRRSGLSAESRS